MKMIRAIALCLLVPVAAIASPTVRAQAPCCVSGHCCPHCPLCPSHLHAPHA
jgi:hypothetical protein